VPLWHVLHGELPHGLSMHGRRLGERVRRLRASQAVPVPDSPDGRRPVQRVRRPLALRLRLSRRRVGLRHRELHGRGNLVRRHVVPPVMCGPDGVELAILRMIGLFDRTATEPEIGALRKE